jgi:hypothetical protein
MPYPRAHHYVLAVIAVIILGFNNEPSGEAPD